LKSNIRDIRKQLIGLLGDERVVDSPVHLQQYSLDISWAEPKMPDLVVLPETVEEVQGICRLASKYGVPLVPRVAGTNVGGLTLPLRGGIVVDLSRMNRILEINEETHYVVIEPGVTFSHLCSELYRRGFRLPYSSGPPVAGVMPQVLLYGPNTTASLNGPAGAGDQVTSMEVVLSDGKLVRLGSAAFSDSWHTMLPMPRLDGLFMGWLGTTGIVTKMGLQVFPMPEYFENYTVGTDSLVDLLKFTNRWGRFDMSDGDSVSNWWKDQRPIPYPYAPKPDGAPEWLCHTLVTGFSRMEVDAKRELWEKTLRDLQGDGLPLTRQEPEVMVLGKDFVLPAARFHSQYMDEGSRTDAVTWAGTYPPHTACPAIYEKWKEIYMRRNLSPAVIILRHRGTVYGMMRCITPFCNSVPEESENARGAVLEAARVALDNGGFPYKPYTEFVQEFLDRADPGFVQLLCDVKDTLDPKGIMNPGRWVVR